MTGHWAASPPGSPAFFGLDVTHVRIAFVVLSVLGGAGLPLYLAAWALIPDKGSEVAIADGILHVGGHWS